MSALSPRAVWLLGLLCALLAGWLDAHPRTADPRSALAAAPERPVARPSAQRRAPTGTDVSPNASGTEQLVASLPPVLGLGAPPTTAEQDFALERDRERHERIEDEVLCAQRNYVAGAVATGTNLLDPPAPVSDGKTLDEGSRWTEPASVRWLREDARVVVDLGRTRRVRRLVIQADNNEGYFVEGSLDGLAYQLLWTAPAVRDPGLRTREVVLPQRERIQFLRVSARDGDGYYATSELQAYCK